MEGKGFTSYLGGVYRLQPTVLGGVTVAYSQSDVDYTTADVTRGDITLMSVLPYAHRSPRPGLGVWGVGRRGLGRSGSPRRGRQDEDRLGDAAGGGKGAAGG